MIEGSVELDSVDMNLYFMTPWCFKIFLNLHKGSLNDIHRENLTEPQFLMTRFLISSYIAVIFLNLGLL